MVLVLEVLVEGRIQIRSFEDQAGQRRWATEVVAKSVQLLDKTESKTQAAPVGKQETEEFVDDADLASDLPF